MPPFQLIRGDLSLPASNSPAEPLAVFLRLRFAQNWIITFVVLTNRFDMVTPLKLRALGNSVGTIIPKEALARLNVKEGDTLYLTEAPNGEYRLTAGDPDFAETMEIAEGFMKRYRNALRELAK